MRTVPYWALCESSTDRSTWDDVKLATQLKELSELALEFDIEATGFEPPEIDLRIQSLEDTDAADRADEFEFASGPSVSAVGDLWALARIELLRSSNPFRLSKSVSLVTCSSSAW